MILVACAGLRGARQPHLAGRQPSANLAGEIHWIPMMTRPLSTLLRGLPALVDMPSAYRRHRHGFIIGCCARALRAERGVWFSRRGFMSFLALRRGYGPTAVIAGRSIIGIQ